MQTEPLSIEPEHRARLEPGPFAALMRKSRERAGLSQRDVARLMRVSSATVATAELGGDPRRSTLARLAASLPLCDPRRLLREGEAVLPISTTASWRFFRRVLRASIRRVSVTSSSGVLRVEAEGIRPFTETVRDPGVLASLLGAVSGLDRDALHDVLLAAERGDAATVETSVGGVSHAFTLSSVPDRDGIGYKRISQAKPHDTTVSYAPRLPVEELVILSSESPSNGSMPACAVRSPFVAGRGTLAGCASTWSTWDPDRRESSATFLHPLPFLSHELVFVAPQEADVSLSGRRIAASDAGAALRRARERAGLSCRALASRLGLSVATVHGAENGLDARRSTLVSLLSALPALQPEDVIPAAEPSREATRAEAWEQLRQSSAVEAAREIVTCTDGKTATCRIEGLRRLDGSDTPVTLRMPSEAGAGATDPAGDSTLSATDGTLVRRVDRGTAGAGLSHDVRLPVRELVLDLRSGTPADLVATARLSHAGASRDVIHELHGERIHLDVAEGGLHARLTIAEPIPGMRYAIEPKS